MTGGLTLIWCAVWWYLVYDSPAQHPRISDTERKYLERAIGDSIASHKVHFKIPRIKSDNFYTNKQTRCSTKKPLTATTKQTESH
jgi:hypothetical protein